MSVLTKTYVLATLVCLLNCPSLFAANIAIIESQSYHSLHKMDAHWQTIAQDLGHTAFILSQADLDDPTTFQDADIIILSSGLINISASRKQNIVDFVENGGNAYIQAEYLTTHPGNEVFKAIANQLGAQFKWEGNTNGSLAPMHIINEAINELTNIDSLTYFWYGTYGSGNEQVIPVLEHNNKNYGFLLCSDNPLHGKVVTISDQDWVRNFSKPDLMRNILFYLAAHPALLALPDFLIACNEQEVCPGQDVSFSCEIDQNLHPTAYQWTINGVAVPTANLPNFTANNLSDGDVIECLLSFDADCAAFTVTSNPILLEQIQPLDPPQIEINANETTACAGSMLSLESFTHGIGEATNIRYQWLLNGNILPGVDGSTISANDFEDQDIISLLLTYDGPCTTDNMAYSNEITLNITDNVTPIATIQGAEQIICSDRPATFTLSGNHWGTSPSFDWLIDGQSIGVHTATFSTQDLQTGQTIQCLVTSSIECVTATIATTDIITVDVLPSFEGAISIDASAYAICEGETVTFMAIGLGFGDTPSFQWHINGDNVGSDSETFTTNQLTTGAQVSYTLTTSTLCDGPIETTTEPISIEVSTPQQPSLEIVVDKAMSCDGSTITFTAQGEHLGDNPQYRWTVDGQQVAETSPVFSPASLTNGQEVACTVRSTVACLISDEAVAAPIIAQISNLQVELLEVVHEHCEGTNGLIEVEAFGGVEPYTYQWSNGQSESFLTDLTYGTYDLMVVDANGCTVAMTVTIENQTSDIIRTVQVQQPNCLFPEGTATVFLNDIYQTYTFQWINEAGDIVAETAKAENLPGGTYELIVTNEAGCTQTQAVELERFEAINFDLPTEVEASLSKSTQLNLGLNRTDVQIEWFPATGLSCTDCPNPVAQPIENTLYTVTVTNEFGCSAVKEVLVRVAPNQDVFIPNAFTPDGDGQNDYFTVFGGAHVARVKSLKVFDRWGSVVFSKSNFDINQEAEGWDGRQNGKNLQQGVYIYLSEVEFIDGSTKKFQGDISITP